MRTALVTGGGRGIGLAIALTLARAGHRVAVTYRGGTPPPAATGLPEAGVLAVRCDVTSADQVDQAFTAVEGRLGPVEVLVANAGMTADGPLVLMPEERFTEVLDTNLTGVYRCVRRAAPAMVRAGWGRMVLLGSEVGLSGNAGQANYAASKAGLVGLARSAARELGPHGITVNTVAPGWIDTDMTAGLAPAHRATVLERVVVPRAGTVADVAAVTAWLAGEEAGYVTGAVVPVDGGLGLGW